MYKCIILLILAATFVVSGCIVGGQSMGVLWSGNNPSPTISTTGQNQINQQGIYGGALGQSCVNRVVTTYELKNPENGPSYRKLMFGRVIFSRLDTAIPLPSIENLADGSGMAVTWNIPERQVDGSWDVDLIPGLTQVDGGDVIEQKGQLPIYYSGRCVKSTNGLVQGSVSCKYCVVIKCISGDPSIVSFSYKGANYDMETPIVLIERAAHPEVAVQVNSSNGNKTYFSDVSDSAYGHVLICVNPLKPGSARIRLQYAAFMEGDSFYDQQDYSLSPYNEYMDITVHQKVSTSVQLTPSSGLLPLSVRIDPTRSSDPEGRPLMVMYEFTEGTTIQKTSFVSLANGITDHVFSTPGKQSVKSILWNGLAYYPQYFYVDVKDKDTDGDGVLDSQDAYPLDPTRSKLSPLNPSDQTAPVITVDTPYNIQKLP